MNRNIIQLQEAVKVCAANSTKNFFRYWAKKVMVRREQGETMLANRLTRIAEDIEREFTEFEILALLRNAITLAASRPTLNNKQYRQESESLKTRAAHIAATTIFRIYPLDLLTMISNSDLSSILPGNIAKLIIAGFPDDKEAAISSAELQMYANNATTVLGQIAGLVMFSNRLGIHSYQVPDEKVGLDLKFPRPVFENHVGSFGRKLSNFNNFMQSTTELTTGSRHEIQLIFLSTTDPIVSCALIPVAAWGVLQFYKLLLEVAEKQINVWKAIRDLKNSGLDRDETASITKKMQDVIQSEVLKGVELALLRIQPQVDQSRLNEIKVDISKRAIEITADIAKGTRIYVSLESQQQIDLIEKSSPVTGDGESDLREQIEQQKAIEARLDGILMIDRPIALIELAKE